MKKRFKFIGFFSFLVLNFFIFNQSLAEDDPESDIDAQNLQCHQQVLALEDAILVPLENQRVQLLWFPSLGLFEPTTMLIATNGIIWDTDPRYSKTNHTLRTQERFTRKYNTGFFAITIDVSQEEFKNIELYMKSDLMDTGTELESCSYSACKPILQNTDLKMPQFLSAVPSVAAAYLSTLSAFGYKKISSVEYRGSTHHTRFLSIGPILELSLPLYTLYLPSKVFGSLLVEGMNQTGDIIKSIISFVSNLGIGQTIPRQSDMVSFNLPAEPKHSPPKTL